MHVLVTGGDSAKTCFASAFNCDSSASLVQDNGLWRSVLLFASALLAGDETDTVGGHDDRGITDAAVALPDILKGTGVRYVLVAAALALRARCLIPFKASRRGQAPNSNRDRRAAIPDGH